MGIMVSEVYEALIDAGASEAKAKAAAEAIPVSEQLATRQDLAEVKASLEVSIAAIEAKVWRAGVAIAALAVLLNKFLDWVIR
jgi:ethanolamine utilization microcompartment shell protein EutL